MQLETVVGDALANYIPDLARLRMTVFREYPYLYDGSEAYEAEYLRTYTASGQAIAVLAREGDAIVGASTGIPLAAETEAFVRPFEALGLDPATVFYCGESVLLRHGADAGFIAPSSRRARPTPESWALCHG